MFDWKRLLNEPVWFSSVIRASIYMLAQFGFELTTGQVTGIIGVTELILIGVTRAMVTPNQLAESRVAQGFLPTKPIDEQMKSTGDGQPIVKTPPETK